MKATHKREVDVITTTTYILTIISIISFLTFVVNQDYWSLLVLGICGFVSLITSLAALISIIYTPIENKE